MNVLLRSRATRAAGAAAVATGALFSLACPLPRSWEAARARILNTPPSRHEAQFGAWVARAGPLPLVENDRIVFLVHSDADHPPRIVGDLNGWGASGESTDTDANAGRMTRLGASHWFELHATAEPTARLEYLVVIGQQPELDARNPHRVQGVGGEVSEIRMPGCRVVKELDASTPVPSGSIHREDFRARNGEVRRLAWYTPPGYSRSTGLYPLALFHDGGLMLDRGVPAILDRLIAAGRIAPLVAVFVDPLDRAADYALAPAWRAVFTDELLPRVESELAVSRQPVSRAVLGVSRSAVGAIDLARAPGARFGFCGLLIPAFQPVPLLEAVAAQPLSPLRAAVVLARYDARWLGDGKRLAAALRAAGAEVALDEVPEGHATETWRRNLGVVLERFAPGPQAMAPMK